MEINKTLYRGCNNFDKIKATKSYIAKPTEISRSKSYQFHIVKLTKSCIVKPTKIPHSKGNLGLKKQRQLWSYKTELTKALYNKTL